MKKISTILLVFLMVVACNKEHSKDYISFSGELINNKDSIVTISNRQGVIKKIKINANGTFKDTLKLNIDQGEVYTFQTSESKIAPIYLKNGYDIYIKGNSDEFMNSFKYSGKGSSNSNFILAQIKKSKDLGDPRALLNLEKENFKKEMNILKTSYDSILNSYNDLDSIFKASIKQQNEHFFMSIENAYVQNKAMAKGMPSPKFENYIDIKGGKKSLDDFKGKYVYIDVWATWCGPCIQQIPYLQAIEKEYHNKNIVFVSISTDEARRSGGSWENAEKKWRDFVKSKNMSGYQLWSGQDFSFQEAYQITGIPRFILIDPKGKIVNANAPRPSDPRLKDLFTSLKI
jgi:thiol-disulfide isomerase/thioredoxin